MVPNFYLKLVGALVPVRQRRPTPKFQDDATPVEGKERDDTAWCGVILSDLVLWRQVLPQPIIAAPLALPGLASRFGMLLAFPPVL